MINVHYVKIAEEKNKFKLYLCQDFSFCVKSHFSELPVVQFLVVLVYSEKHSLLL